MVDQELNARPILPLRWAMVNQALTFQAYQVGEVSYIDLKRQRFIYVDYNNLELINKHIHNPL